MLARADSPRLDQLRSVPGVVLLERPVHIRSMVSAVQAALRARRRQYELRNQLEQTNAANFELQNQARAKDDFLATLSHELRNPLSALTTAANLLDRQDLGANAEHTARQVVKRQTALMGRLLDDLLDLSRITRGRLEIRKVAHRAVRHREGCGGIGAALADAQGSFIFSEPAGSRRGDRGRPSAAGTGVGEPAHEFGQVH